MATTLLQTTQLESQRYFTEFRQGQDIISNPSKKYIQLALPKTSISLRLSNTPGLYTSSGGLVSAVIGSKNDAYLYGPIQSMFRYDKTDMSTDWIPVSNSTLTQRVDNFLQISFSNTIIGDKLSLEDDGSDAFAFSVGNTAYTVTTPTSGDIYDIAPMFRTAASNFGYVKQGGDFAGLFFGQLGMILLYGNTTPNTVTTFTPTNVVMQQTLNSMTYFCRITHDMYNASNNPTWMQLDAASQQYVPTNDPSFTAITTIGLYDENNTLMAIGKFSQPILKQIDSQLHAKVVLQY